MSLIRSTSNPEKLYVFEHVDGYIAWCGNDLAPWVKLPTDDFYTLCNLGRRSFAKVGELEIKDQWVHSETGEIFDTDPNHNCWDKFIQEEVNRIPAEIKTVLYYKDKPICAMWKVTWDYIINTANRRKHDGKSS
jgi:hypothetical protein